MLSLFPQILFLGSLGIALLRIVAGFCFLYVAYRIAARPDTYEGVRLPIIGHPSAWMVWLSALITFATGVLLVIGLYTQAAAILGVIIALKHVIGAKYFSLPLPLSAGAYLLLAAIGAALVVTGGGARAFDLPL